MTKQLISVTVFPASKKNTVTKLTEDSYQIHLKAKPERNQANKLLIQALAEYFTVEAKNIRILTGHHSAHKRVEINRL